MWCCIAALVIFQQGFNYSQDGPGNRLGYHLAGCNMRCLWCSNPEGISGGGESVTVEEMVRFAQSCRPMFFDGGGVTLTGGEPTMQFGGVSAFLALLRTAGIHAAMETNGTHERLPELFGLIDHLIMDCKHYDSGTHKRFTKCGNETVFQNIRTAADTGKPLHIRIPLIDGFNASTQDIDGFVEAFTDIDTTGFDFEFLPYHELGKGKWEQNHMEYSMSPAFVSEETVAAFTGAFEQAGLKVIKS